MNAFARGLFQLLVGWLRGLSALTDRSWTQLDGLFSFLSGNWLGLVLLLILLGTVLDLVVWFFRWRPDRFWRSRLRRLRSFSLREYRMNRRFRRGYTEDNTEIMEAARPILMDQGPDRTPYAQPAVNALNERTVLETDLGLPAQEEQDELSGGRRRRSDKYHSGLRAAVDQVRSRLRGREDEETFSQDDPFPPIMTKEEAFRAPVYPKGKPRPGDRREDQP